MRSRDVFHQRYGRGFGSDGNARLQLLGPKPGRRRPGTLPGAFSGPAGWNITAAAVFCAPRSERILKSAMEIPGEVFDFLRRTDTCTVSNAIETFNIRMRNEGFVHGEIHCMFPEMAPVTGYAVTARLRAAAPPISGLCYYQRHDFWQYIASIPTPRIVIMKDMDSVAGIGAMAGEIHARICQALGCVAWVTNGSVRDLAQVRAAGFQFFACGASVSHSYAHVVDFGEPVEIGGLKISPGDLLHGDSNGLQTIPVSIAGRIPEAVRRIQEREAELVRFCQSPEFSLEKLGDVLGRAAPWGQTLEVR
jgi:4-hydroxy-4-methyl-2-oxoglutarate aldolase